MSDSLPSVKAQEVVERIYNEAYEQYDSTASYFNKEKAATIVAEALRRAMVINTTSDKEMVQEQLLCGCIFINGKQSVYCIPEHRC